MILSAVSRIFKNFMISAWLVIIVPSPVIYAGDFSGIEHSHLQLTEKNPEVLSSDSTKLISLNNLLKVRLISGRYDLGKIAVSEILALTGTDSRPYTVVADSYYYVGVYYKLTGEFNKSNQFLLQSISLKEKLSLIDETYTKALYNLGGNYSRLGFFNKHKEYTLKALKVEKQIYGERNPELIGTYASLITANIELKEYDEALELAETVYDIVGNNETYPDLHYIAFLYHNMGFLYNSTGDFTKSKIFFEKAEEYYIKAGKTSGEGYMDLMNSMAFAYRNLGLTERSEEYFRKGIKLALLINSPSAHLVISSYALSLGRTGRVKEGESVLSDLLNRIRMQGRSGTVSYYEVLGYYANYIREFNIDKVKSFEYYATCIKYFDKQGYSFQKYSLKEGYAMLLAENGDFEKSLEVLQSLLFSENTVIGREDRLINPAIDSINADRDFLGTVRTKYGILKDYYENVPELKILEAAANTGELIISLLEKIRINISEEESRLLLGDRYRDSYLSVISDFYLLYSKTSNSSYLDKVFEYSEKSKIAGLLAATRELKAAEFHIPAELAMAERSLQQEAAILNDRIAGRSEFGNASGDIVDVWKKNLFNTILKRDSLIKVFEKDYPDYYSIKYNTRVVSADEIPRIIGRKANYISFVASDTSIFISVINKKHQKTLAITVDSTFYDRIIKYRNLLSMPAFNNARIELMDYYTAGYELYSTLIAPVKPYLISERVVISPDNILSYIPFETLPVSTGNSHKLSYRNVEYLMNELDISYTYSATFMAENISNGMKTGNLAIAFAPDYSEPVDINTIFHTRQHNGNILAELPFAKKEAEYVYELLGGKLLLNDYANESSFKQEAGNFDIIHLAMHTVIDDNDPMYSTLIFSPEGQGEDDSFLRTYEIYNIPLKAKMVVLSSCNTGVGKLFSGEGILSLARGFIYSGSQSVVMSMWEIEDRTGTEIVKLYYSNLKKGYSKSVSLKKARIDFLKTADQLRAHPYFWSALVVYGDNSPIFRHRWILPAAVALILLLSILAFYCYIKPRYS